jgi:hypothetical protein
LDATSTQRIRAGAKFPLHTPEFTRCSEDARQRSWYNRYLPSDMPAEAPAKAEARWRAPLFDIVFAVPNVAPAVTRAATGL